MLPAGVVLPLGVKPFWSASVEGHIGAMAEKRVSRTTAATKLIAELQKLPPDAEVVTSIYGWARGRAWRW